MKYVGFSRSRPPQNRGLAAALLGLGLILTVPFPSMAAKTPTQSLACLYAFEWLHSFRFPLQPDPHAAFSYVVPQLPGQAPIGFLVDAEFPYAAWFSWTIYGAKGLPVSLESDHEI